MTAVLGALMAETGKMQTYQDALDAILSKSVILPELLLIEIEEFVKENKDLGYVTKEDFLRDGARLRLRDLRDKVQAQRNGTFYLVQTKAHLFTQHGQRESYLFDVQVMMTDSKNNIYGNELERFVNFIRENGV